MTPTEPSSDPIAALQQAITAYRAARAARDEAIASAAIAYGREAAAKASGLSISRVHQLVAGRTNGRRNA